MSSIKKNYFYSAFINFLNIGFPIITIPYLTRVLGPESFGKINFFLSFVQYFIIFANLGIQTYAVREIARVRDNREKLDKVFSEIFSLYLVSNIVTSVIYLVFPLFLDKARNEFILFLIMGLMLLLNFMNISWFYLGIENFKYVSLRNAIFKALSLVLIFLLVKNPNDYVKYGAIVSFAAFGPYILDFLLSRKYVKISITNENIVRHLRLTLIFFLSSVFSTLYSGIDIILLGFLQNDQIVGIFSTAKKIVLFILFVINSLISVNYVRLSYYLGQGMVNEYQNLLLKSINLVYFVAFAIFSVTLGLSKEIIMIFGGEKFSEASTVLAITSLIIVITIMRNISESQFLLPHGKEKIILLGSLLGWLSMLILGIVFVPKYSYIGMSIIVVFAEIVTLSTFTISTFNTTKKLPLLTSELWKYFVASLLSLLSIILTKGYAIKLAEQINFVSSYFLVKGLFILACVSGIGLIVYVLALFAMKDKTLKEILNLVSSFSSKILKRQ
jgi:O-antigen/teichoic acid export membrane protein